MATSSHFAIGAHPQHGLVAAATSLTVTPPLAHWLLTREQFEPVPGTPGLFRLTDPERDGPRRAAQAAHSLRGLGYAVHTDYTLALTAESGLRPTSTDSRAPLVQAAARTSPQLRTAPTTRPAPARALPPKPAYAPTVHRDAGRSR
ncbi:hypothetical protein [Streptomyces sp. NPDC006285]|uniref:hypothetical protein n=1 Tax=Streptomyces sp. NPDC006285 TaxID=3364742 RepID=UPI003680F046